MKLENPAERLVTILNKARFYPNPVGANCTSAWRDILGLTPDDGQLMLHKRLAETMELPVTIERVMTNAFEGSRWRGVSWQPAVNKAFTHMTLAGPFNSFSQHITDSAISELNMISMLIHGKGEQENISEEQMKLMLEKLNALKSEIIESDLSAELKNNLLRYLYKIIHALDDYLISGLEPVMDAVEATFGNLLLNPGYREAIKKESLGKKFYETIGLVANAVTVATGVAPLIAPVVIKVIEQAFPGILP